MRFTIKLFLDFLPVAALTVLLSALLVFGSAFATAQEYEYRLGPKDLINLSVYAGGVKQLDADLFIHADGKITVPMLGPFPAKGKTVEELVGTISVPLGRDYFVDPQVTVSIKEYHSLSFYLSGSVAKPGHYELSIEPSIMELISKAGGLKPDHGRMAYVLRENLATAEKTESLAVDLVKLFDQGSMSGNIQLKSGDIIHIPLAAEQDQSVTNVFVEGEVAKPGKYKFQPGLTALNACIQAGGFTKFAAPNRARILRKKDSGQEIIKIDLDDVKSGKIPDLQLQPGDLLHIPETWL